MRQGYSERERQRLHAYGVFADSKMVAFFQLLLNQFRCYSLFHGVFVSRFGKEYLTLGVRPTAARLLKTVRSTTVFSEIAGAG